MSNLVMTIRMLSRRAAVIAVLAAPLPVGAQVRLELRLRAQTGTLPGPVTDSGDNRHNLGFGQNQRKRFEVQYRLVDTNLTDAISPCGLASVQIAITSAQSNGGDQWTLERVRLSRFESQLAASTPPTSPDTSGLPQPNAIITGLHRPFRAGAAMDTNTANGTFTGRAITGIIPLSFAAPMQGPCGGAPADAWFGVYSFDVALPFTPFVDIVVTATPIPDVQTGLRFAYWSADGNPVPRSSTEAAPATGIVPGDTGPPPTFTCCVGHSCVAVTFPQTCASVGGVFVSNDNICNTLPAPCCRADLNGGGISLQDLFDFLGFWFALDTRGDFNRTGGVTLQDLFDYLAAWFAGC